MMMIKTSVLLLAVGIVSCGAKKSSDDAPASPAPNSPSTPAGDQAPKSDGTPIGDFKAKIAGIWLEPCHSSTDSEGDIHYSRTAIVIDGTKLSFNTQNFSDAACSSAITFSAGIISSYTIDQESKNHAGGYIVKVLPSDISLMSEDGGTVAAMNQSSLCGVTDWKVGEARVVTDKDCKGVTDSFKRMVGKEYSSTLVVTGDKIEMFDRDTSKVADSSATRK